MMRRLIKEMIVVLEQAVSQYSSLLPLLQEEKKAALDWNIQALTEATTEKQVVLARIAYTDRSRNELLNQFAERLDVPRKQITLGRLVQKMPGPLGDHLSNLQAKLNDLLEKIRRSNDENRLTVEHCLSLVHNSLAFWQHWTGPPKVYGNSGMVQNGHGRGCVLSGSV